MPLWKRRWSTDPVWPESKSLISGISCTALLEIEEAASLVETDSEVRLLVFDRCQMAIDVATSFLHLYGSAASKRRPGFVYFDILSMRLTCCAGGGESELASRSSPFSHPPSSRFCSATQPCRTASCPAAKWTLPPAGPEGWWRWFRDTPFSQWAVMLRGSPQLALCLGQAEARTTSISSPGLRNPEFPTPNCRGWKP